MPPSPTPPAPPGALTPLGRLTAWGKGFELASAVPKDLRMGSTVAALACGLNPVVALKIDGTVTAFGDQTYAQNRYGQLDVPADLAGVVAVAAGAYHSMALKSDGTVVSWGGVISSDVSVSYGSADAPAGLAGVTAIAAGQYHSLALLSDGSIVTWGAQAKDNATLSNVPASTREAGGCVAIAAAGTYSLAVRKDGRVIGWGSNDYGTLSAS